MSFDLRLYAQEAPQRPGVYQMLDASEHVLYIGKAKNLHNRLSSYAHVDSPRLQSLVQKIVRITITLCKTEEEALLLEHRLIQNCQPPFNILLKDHKGYPFLVLSQSPEPQISIERHLKKISDCIQGPYPTIGLAKDIFEALIKTYQIRTCSDYVFKTRDRPCLQYQLQRCSAPCVFRDQDSLKKYALQVEGAKIFLKEGIGGQIAQIEQRMLEACAQENFESAAIFRDHIQKLRQIQRQAQGDKRIDGRLDILAYSGSGMAHHLMVFDGQVQRSQSLVIRNPLKLSLEEGLETIAYQFYQSLDPQWVPKTLLADIEHKTVLDLGRFCLTIRPAKGEQEIAWMTMAKDSLVHNKISHNKKSLDEYEEAFKELERIFLQDSWNAIECVDVAHHQGSHVVGAISCFDRQGPCRSRYRKYPLADFGQNNDPLSVSQTLHKHFKRALTGYIVPNVILIDGGKTQLQSAWTVLQGYLGLDLKTVPILIAICKDRTRKNGLETYWTISPGGNSVQIDLSPAPMGILLFQEIRDEAHRIAGQYHYLRAKKALLQHGLSGFKGINEDKKKKLLQSFGGWQGLKQANSSQLQNIEGIGEKLAQRLIEYLNLKS